MCARQGAHQLSFVVDPRFIRVRVAGSEEAFRLAPRAVAVRKRLVEFQRGDGGDAGGHRVRVGTTAWAAE